MFGTRELVWRSFVAIRIFFPFIRRETSMREDKMHLSSRAKIKCKVRFLFVRMSHSSIPFTEINKTSVFFYSAEGHWRQRAEKVIEIEKIAAGANSEQEKCAFIRWKIPNRISIFFSIPPSLSLAHTTFALSSLLYCVNYFLYLLACDCYVRHAQQRHTYTPPPLTHCWVDSRQ